jgi:eukaryotic-like serine/threonine-protein kinase
VPAEPPTRLDILLERHGTLALPDVLALARELLAALRQLHARGVVHRAVHPANVVLQRGAGIEHVRLEDPGTARSHDRDDVEVDSFACLAPEQVRGSSPVDARADLYAVGALVFRAVTGRLPFEATNALTLVALKLDRDAPTLASVTERAWPPELERFVATSLRRERAERYASADAALAELGAIPLAGPA